MIRSVAGLIYGDVGKGRFTDYLMDKHDIVIRFNGGANAGHTIEFSGKKYIVHLMPSGIFLDKWCLIGNDCVLDPIDFNKEIDYIKENGFSENKLRIGSSVTIVCPFHKIIDAFWEENSTVKLGTTRRGIGHAYADRSRRIGLRMEDVFLTDEEISEKFFHCFNMNSEYVPEDYKKSTVYNDYEIFLNDFKKLKKYVCNVTDFMNEHNNENILFEGAQSTQLDITWGEYPFVTSSSCLAQNALVSTGFRKNIDKVYGVSKVYTTRVGTGPFITKMDDNIDDLVRNIGGEFGATTGRKRICGWLDLVSLKRSCLINGVTDLCIVKTDVFNNFDTIKVCIGYEENGKIINRTPYTSEYSKLNPVYVTFAGWKNEKDEKLENFIRYIEQFTETHVKFVSYGADRYKLIER